MTAEEFLRQHQKKATGSKMAPFFDDIVKLRRAGLSYRDVLEFLRINGVEVSYAALAMYIKRNGPVDILPKEKEHPVPNQAVKTKQENFLKKQSPYSSENAPDVFAKTKKPEVDLSFLNEEE